MQITRKINLNVKETVERSVSGNCDFHFYVDELSSNNYMPTYSGMADEKYKFDDMDDEFFQFLNKKASEDGIYIRLVFATCDNSNPEEAIFKLEYGGVSETFKTDDFDNILEFEFADFGVKVKGCEVTFGTTIEGGCGQTPYFAEFGSAKGNREYLSLKNPLNLHIIEILEKMIVIDE